MHTGHQGPHSVKYRIHITNAYSCVMPSGHQGPSSYGIKYTYHKCMYVKYGRMAYSSRANDTHLATLCNTPRRTATCCNGSVADSHMYTREVETGCMTRIE